MKRLIIVAHPDDELLWFSSIITKPDSALIFCFQNKYPREFSENMEYTKKIFEIIEEYKKTIPVVWIQTIKTTTPRIYGIIPQETITQLRLNLNSIIDMFEPNEIYTHNQFGEYGHSEHIIIHKIIKEKVKNTKIKMFFPSEIITQKEKEHIEKELKVCKLSKKSQIDVNFREKMIDEYIKRKVWTGEKFLKTKENDEFISYID